MKALSTEMIEKFYFRLNSDNSSLRTVTEVNVAFTNYFNIQLKKHDMKITADWLHMENPITITTSADLRQQKIIGGMIDVDAGNRINIKWFVCCCDCEIYIEQLHMMAAKATSFVFSNNNNEDVKEGVIAKMKSAYESTIMRDQYHCKRFDEVIEVVVDVVLRRFNPNTVYDRYLMDEVGIKTSIADGMEEDLSRERARE